MRAPRIVFLTVSGLLPLACEGPSPSSSDAPFAADPRLTEVAVAGASRGWDASLLLDNGGVGVWTVKPIRVFPQYGTPEVVGLDDLGRCRVLVSYSGKWTPVDVLAEGRWLGAIAEGDVDPRVARAEFYVGGQRGNLYQCRAFADGTLDARRIAHFDGREIHTLLAGSLDFEPGAEVLVFTRPGALYRLRPTGSDGAFVTTRVQELPGRVRDALVLPGGGREILTASRAGRIELVRLGADGYRAERVYTCAMGLGRLALRPQEAGPTVVYATRDDGVVLRLERSAEGFEIETIYRGAQGPRGLAAGRFFADPTVEGVALFGYGKKVELLRREKSGWVAETIFEDRAKGHWLSVAELDGRNTTDELLLSGYGGRVIMLARPVGYGASEDAARAARPETRPASG